MGLSLKDKGFVTDLKYGESMLFEINDFIKKEISANEFKFLLVDVATILTKMGAKDVIPFNSIELIHFNKLSPNEKFVAYSNLNLYKTTLKIEDSEPDGNKKALWAALVTFGLTPSSDCFNEISDTDVIEIYSHDNIQIWRNFNFIQSCSFDLESIFCRPWTELFTRPVEVLTELSTSIMSIFENQKLTPIQPISGTHQIKELNSEKNFAFEANHKTLFPLKHRVTKKVVAYLVNTEVLNIQQQEFIS